MDPEATQEIEELKRRNQQLGLDVERLLTQDQLTGLMVRSAFIGHVDRWLGTLKGKGVQSALIEIGIKGMPRLNALMGRDVGDYVISALASRLNQLVDGDRICCRLDHWSFAVFVPRVADALEALTIAKRTILALGEPVEWVDRKIPVEVAAGVALAGTTERDAQTLLIQAGMALRSTAEKGGPGYSFFNPALEKAAKRKQDVQTALQEALDHQYFELHFQPYFQVTTGELQGFEALIRLRHPQLGSVSPGEFIPVAEETGLITRIGAWALVEACRTAANWPPHLLVSVNFSPEQFMSGNLLTDVHNALEVTSFPPTRLEVEITESTMLGDTDVVLSQLTALREMGCAIVMDDFGTGYSSLSYLWKFPFSKLKIDRSFIQAMDSRPQVKGMLKSIIDLAKNLGLKVTAEGIETQKQAELLKFQRCDYIQGYLCGRPVPASELAAIIMTKFAETLRNVPEPVEEPQAKAASASDLRFEF
ncbi:MAG: bifunctional diguanylate cyclase/phosphodiesterase [Proteobacteria bacterium]|nr:bifunctional diguanylate cyclase/phosphodiesterase [Pseudomonadota bacterium]